MGVILHKLLLTHHFVTHKVLQHTSQEIVKGIFCVIFGCQGTRKSECFPDRHSTKRVACCWLIDLPESGQTEDDTGAFVSNRYVSGQLHTVFQATYICLLNYLWMGGWGEFSRRDDMKFWRGCRLEKKDKTDECLTATKNSKWKSIYI